MNRLASLTAALLLSASAAYAADLPTSYKDNASLPATAGFYIGLGVGGAVNDAGTAGNDFGFSGFLGDIRAGYDMKLDGWVAGPYAEVSFEDVKGKVSLNSAVQNSGANSTIGYSFGARVGRVVNGDSLIYALLGWQGQHVGISNTGWSADLSGLRAGGGIEIDLKNHFAVGAEVSWIGYGQWTPAAAAPSINADEVRSTARLSYRF
jgi:opacity protein-like surface antigen